jgi:putative intracellular protease/amidase
MMRALFAAALIALAAPTLAQDKPDGSWWSTPEVTRCCSEADAVFADRWQANPDGSITATVTGGGPRDHAWAPIGREYTIPADKVIAVPGNPTGRAILFVRPWNLEPLCFAYGPMI